MFFRRKKEKRTIPLEQIQAMQRNGMSDRNIIGELKSKGYSYDEIESAMLRTVKQGIAEEPKKPIVAEAPVPASSGLESSFAESPMEDVSKEETPSDIFSEAVPDLDELSLKDASPEIVIEELIEGVVEEKWQKMRDQFEKLTEDFNNLKAGIKHVKPASGTAPVEDTRVDEIITQIEDLEARIGGLEKAFKQFLPSLTKNIESLSTMIHEMKQRQF